MSQPTVESRLPPAGVGPEPDWKNFQGGCAQTRAVSPVRQRISRDPRSLLTAFRLVLAGSSISALGTKISTLAFPMLILWLGRSPELAGLSVFATVIPGMLLYFPAGIAVDKLNPWRVMIFSEIFRGIVAISVAFSLLEYRRSVNIAFLIVAMLAEEILEMFTTLAERRYLNRMMDPGETKMRRSQQASIEARAHVAVLTGRPVAPFLFTLSPLSPFLADAISFIFSVTGLFLGERKWKQRNFRNLVNAGTSSTSKPPEPETEAGSVVGALQSALNDSTIWLGGSLMSMTSMVSQALILIFLTEANSHQFSTAEIGIVLAVSGLGGATGSFCSKFLPGAIRKRWIPVQMGAWLITCFALALTGGHSAWLGGCTMFVFSVTGAIGNVEFSTYLNVKIKDNMLGKVSGLGCAMSIGACAIGPVIGGYSVQQLGLNDAVTLLLGIVGLMTLCSLFLLRNPLHESNLGTSKLTAGERTSNSAFLEFRNLRLIEAPPTPSAISEQAIELRRSGITRTYASSHRPTPVTAPPTSGICPGN